jgi:ElaB/YqjD/DUF883 family membrane-anchored ribosome-binding protein
METNETRTEETQAPMNGGIAASTMRVQHAAADKLHMTAQQLERAAQYVSDIDVGGVSENFREAIRKQPLRALAIGFGVGLLFGRLARR